MTFLLKASCGVIVGVEVNLLTQPNEELQKINPTVTNYG